jgi:hypothetical protein
LHYKRAKTKKKSHSTLDAAEKKSTMSFSTKVPLLRTLLRSYSANSTALEIAGSHNLSDFDVIVTGATSGVYST